MNANSLDKLNKALQTANAVLVGAGAGLSTAAGFTYSGKRFFENFADFNAKYGITDMYSGGFFPYPEPEEFWAYWSRYIYLNRYLDPPKPVYRDLFELVGSKDYFVITTNVDHCFQKAGFDKMRLFYTQGDFGLFQCSVPCRNKTYDNEKLILRMLAEQKNMKIPPELVPRCPVCGAPMTTNLRVDDKFVQDDGWQTAYLRYEDFVYKHKDARVLCLELGVGGNTPAIIKYPFWRFTRNNRLATYTCINRSDTFAPREIQNRSICLNGDIAEVLTELRRSENRGNA